VEKTANSNLETLVEDNDLLKLTKWADSVMESEGRRYLEEVPRASHLTDDSSLDIDYYVRHRIETVWRIWLTAKIDAIALAHMVVEDYESARQWSRYVADELDHDKMFLRDLVEHGVSIDEVRATPPFQSTLSMLQDIEQNMNSLGALPAVAYALFVEWNAERFSEKAVVKATANLSNQHVVGAKRHVMFDLEERHLPMILDISQRLLSKRGESTDTLERLVRSIAAHFRAYFTELDADDSCRAVV